MTKHFQFFIVEESMEELLTEGLLRSQVHTAITEVQTENSSERVPELPKESNTHIEPTCTTFQITNEHDEKHKELVPIDFKVGRHKPKPSDNFITKFKFV